MSSGAGAEPNHTVIRIGIPLGDAAGIGPEVVLKALIREAQRPNVNSEQSKGKARAFVTFGPSGVLENAAAHLGINLALLRSKITLEHRNTGTLDSSLVFCGKDHPETGRAAYDALTASARSALSKEVEAVVTAPLSKAAMHEAGIGFSGNTEVLADETGTKNFAMGFAADDLRILLLTTHIALREVPESLTRDLILRKVYLADDFLRRDLGITHPRLALAALNPHAGEAGAMGREELEIMIPAVHDLQKEGVMIEGPFPADTLFVPERRKGFDLLVCCYHDQGLAPLKMIAFDRAVNVTLGLPIVRTSPDHGTAYAIAGKGCADPGSMIAAIDLAETIAVNRAKHLE